MIAYVTDADYDKVKANQENFTITFQSKNRPPMRVEVKGGNASAIETKPKRGSPSFEMVVERRTWKSEYKCCESRVLSC